jgi:hypothetical protein
LQQVAQAPVAIAKHKPEGKGISVGPLVLAFSAWFLSAPSATFGLLSCFQWMVAHSSGHLPIPKFLEYPFYIVLWIASALAAIAAVTRRLGEIAALLGIISLVAPRTPLLVRVITLVVLVLSIVGIWVMQARTPSPTFPF